MENRGPKPAFTPSSLDPRRPEVPQKEETRFLASLLPPRPRIRCPVHHEGGAPMKRGHETGEEHLGCILYPSVKSVLPPVHRTPFHNHPATLSRCRLCRSLPHRPHASSPRPPSPGPLSAVHPHLPRASVVGLLGRKVGSASGQVVVWALTPGGQERPILLSQRPEDKDKPPDSCPCGLSRPSSICLQLRVDQSGNRTRCEAISQETYRPGGDSGSAKN